MDSIPPQKYSDTSYSSSATKHILPTPTHTQYSTKDISILTATPTVTVTPTPISTTLPGAIYRINLSSTGMEANNSSEGVSINENGSILAFVSFASNLVENDTDDDCLSISGEMESCADIFLKDLTTNEIKRISEANNGIPGNNHSGIMHEWGSYTSISSDGRYITFYSNADNLLPDVTPKNSYLFDTKLNQIQLIGNTDTYPEQSTHFYNINPAISANGRFVVFQSNNPNLVQNDTNGVDDIFLFDIQTGQIERVSIGTGGKQADRPSGLGYPATISGNGRFVAFVSEAKNLAPNDTNNLPDIFLRDRTLGTTIRISKNNLDGSLGESNGASTNPKLSADGQAIVFQSSANNLIQNDTNDAIDIFLYHLKTGQIELISVSLSGDLSNGNSSNPDISSNNRWIVFSSDADNLVHNDTNNVTDIFVYDIDTKHTIRVSVNNEGEEGNNISNSPVISGDGNKIAFVSLASNLVSNDSNECWDIFVRDMDLVWDNPYLDSD